MSGSIPEVIATGGMYETTGRLYINADRTRVVPEGSEAAAFILAGPGQKLHPDLVAQLDIPIRGRIKATDTKPEAPPPEKHAGITIQRKPKKTR